LITGLTFELKVSRLYSRFEFEFNKDIAAAKKAGIEGILVNWGFSDHKEDALKTVCELRKKIENEFLKA
jgi:hypothetical protein